MSNRIQIFQRNSVYVFIFFFGAAECMYQTFQSIKNLRTESQLFLFSKKGKFLFKYTFYKYSVFFVCFFTKHVISVRCTLISNYYKNRRRFKHTYLKYMPINKTNESVLLTSITQRSLGKYTVSLGHSLLAHK